MLDSWKSWVVSRLLDFYEATLRFVKKQDRTLRSAASRLQVPAIPGFSVITKSGATHVRSSHRPRHVTLDLLSVLTTLPFHRDSDATVVPFLLRVL
jgi:hypothetical protein